MTQALPAEVQNALELAQAKGAHRKMNLMRKRFGKIHPQAAFQEGQKAKAAHKFRVTPYYDKPGADHFWFAGYDGKTFEEAVATQ